MEKRPDTAASKRRMQVNENAEIYIRKNKTQQIQRRRNTHIRETCDTTDIPEWVKERRQQ